MKLATLEALCERLGIFADRFTEAFFAENSSPRHQARTSCFIFRQPNRDDALRLSVWEVRRAELPGVLRQVVPAEGFVELAAFFEVPVVGSGSAAVLVEPFE